MQIRNHEIDRDGGRGGRAVGGLERVRRRLRTPSSQGRGVFGNPVFVLRPHIKKQELVLRIKSILIAVLGVRFGVRIVDGGFTGSHYCVGTKTVGTANSLHPSFKLVALSHSSLHPSPANSLHHNSFGVGELGGERAATSSVPTDSPSRVYPDHIIAQLL